jgi:hypothetical protein
MSLDLAVTKFPEAKTQTKLPLRRWVRVAHLWAGVVLGLWPVMLDLTGSALVYQHALQQVLERGQRIKPGLPALSIGEALRRVHFQRPDLIVLAIDGLSRDDSAWELPVRPVNLTRAERYSRFPLVTGLSGIYFAAPRPYLLLARASVLQTPARM